MFSFFKNFNGKRNQSTGTLGLSFLADGISLATVRPADDGQICLDYCEFVECQSSADRLQTLEHLSDHYHLGNFSCHLVLQPSEYNLLKIEAPDVPDEEMKQAVFWCIQDMIDFPLEEAVIDYFPLPNFNRPGRESTITVVVTRKDTVADYAGLCKKSGISVDVIDIQELALRNLTERMPEDTNGVALIYLQKNDGMVVLARDAHIYLSRRFDVDLDSIKLDSTQADDGLRDNLALEIQRSLDYYERQFNMPPVSGLVVSPVQGDMGTLFNYLNNNLGTTSRVLDVNGMINCKHVVDDTTQSRCLPAIGGALRVTGGSV